MSIDIDAPSLWLGAFFIAHGTDPVVEEGFPDLIGAPLRNLLQEGILPTKEKEQAVEDLAKRFSESTIMITTDYSGLRVAQMTELRRAMRESGVEFRVIKNSLALMAADSAGKPAMKDVIDGPTGIAFGFGDASEPAKALSDFIRANRSALKIRGAELDGRALTPAEVQQLASLPGKDELIAQLLAQMLSPITGLVGVMNGPVGGLARVLQAHVDNLAQADNSADAGDSAQADDSAEADDSTEADESADAGDSDEADDSAEADDSTEADDSADTDDSAQADDSAEEDDSKQEEE